MSMIIHDDDRALVIKLSGGTTIVVPDDFEIVGRIANIFAACKQAQIVGWGDGESIKSTTPLSFEVTWLRCDPKMMEQEDTE